MENIMIAGKYNLSEQIFMSNDLFTLDIHEEIVIKRDYTSIMGLGERYSRINQKGHTVINVVEDQFCNQGEKTYFPLPFFVIDQDMGVFVDTKAVCSFDFDKDIKIKFPQEVDGTLYVFTGALKEIIEDFIALTGAMRKIPKWAFGPWASAHRWNRQDMVDDFRQKIKDFDIPISVLVLEQWSDEATFYIWNKAKYPDKQFLSYEDFDFSDSPWYDPKTMVDKLHEEGIKLVLWQCPVVKHIPEDEPYNARHQREIQYVTDKRLVIDGEDGPYRIQEGKWFGGSVLPDFNNPEMVKWWFNNRQYLLDMGVDGFKTDGGEFIYSKANAVSGETEAELKNNFSLEYLKAYSDFIGPDRVDFSRAGYIGQQQYTILWSGDQKSTFAELKSMYHAGINASICGQINWGFDIGGFAGELPSLELYLRATQLAVFAPIMQFHSEPVGGQFSVTDPTRVFNNERTPWNIAGGDEKTLQDIRQYFCLRMNILPYIYSEYLKALETKKTLMKHMAVEHEGFYPEDQYMFGQLIVSPVLREGQFDKAVKLPQGKYYNVMTGQVVAGRLVYDRISVKDMFVYIPQGTALVTQTESLIPDRISNDMTYKTLVFRLYGESGHYRFVDEDNDFTVTWKDSKIDVDGHKTCSVKYVQVK